MSLFTDDITSFSIILCLCRTLLINDSQGIMGDFLWN